MHNAELSKNEDGAARVAAVEQGSYANKRPRHHVEAHPSCE